MRITRLRWLFAMGLLLVPASAWAQSEEVIYYHTDAIGSVRATSDASGAVIARYDYSPFGELCEAACGGTPPANAREYAGKERDAETGLDYFGGRYHRAASGRFTTVDPAHPSDGALVNPQLWNRYAYSLNNPLKFTDPDGRNPVFVGGLIGAGVYTAWNAYVNVQQGRPWYENAGVEASKGFLVGATLGVLAPAVGAPLAANSTPIAAELATGSSVAASRRDQLLAAAQNPGLRNAIDNLFRPNAKYGDGSSMAAYAREVARGELLSPTGHGQKLLDRLGQLEKLVRGTQLTDADRKIAEGLIKEIKEVLR